MKKFGAILLTFMMVISIITVPASAEGEVITFDALTDATEYFYDNGGTSIYNLVGDLKLAAGEMASYDVSDLEGTYEVSITYIQNQGESTWYSFVEYSIDDEWQLSSKHLLTAGVSWGGTAVDSGALGNVYINADSKYLKVKNSGRFNLAIDKIKLTPVETEEKAPVTLYTENITSTAESGAVTNGTDYSDAVSFPRSGVNVIAGSGFVIIQPNDWFRYDVSGLKAGYYKLSMNASNYSFNDSTVYFELDGSLLTSKLMAKRITTAAVSEVGMVYIPENAKYLKVYATMSDTQSVRVNEIYFTPVDMVADGLDACTAVTKTNGVVTEGTDFHDEAGVAFGTDVQSIRDFSGINYLALHNGDWVRYDISELKEGTYDVSLFGTSGYLQTTPGLNFKVSLMIDDKLEASNELPRATAAELKNIGKVYIPKNAKYLKVKVETTSTSALYTQYFTFTPVSSGIFVNATNVKDIEKMQYFDGTHTSIKLDYQGTWASYDLSSLPAGDYGVYANYRTAAKVNIALSGEETNNYAIESSGSVFKDGYLGKITLTQNNKSFKIEYLDVDITNRNICISNFKILKADGNKDVNISFEAFGKAGEKVETTEGLAKAYAVIDIENSDNIALGANIYVAVYEGERLKSVQICDAKAVSSYKNVVTVAGLGENTSVKVFAWKDGSLVPVIDEASIAPV